MAFLLNPFEYKEVRRNAIGDIIISAFISGQAIILTPYELEYRISSLRNGGAIDIDLEQELRALMEVKREKERDNWDPDITDESNILGEHKCQNIK